MNWARAGLGLPLLDDAVERKPGAVPVGEFSLYLYNSLSLSVCHFLSLSLSVYLPTYHTITKN